MRCIAAISPMLFSDGDRIHIHAISEPPVRLFDFDVVPTHLSLAHQAVVRKSPIFKAIRPPPLSRLIMPLIPELNGNLW